MYSLKHFEFLFSKYSPLVTRTETFSSLFVLCRNKIMPVARTKECFVCVRELQLWTKKAHTVNTT